jgi:hypothetical protein
MPIELLDTDPTERILRKYGLSRGSDPVKSARRRIGLRQTDEPDDAEFSDDLQKAMLGGLVDTGVSGISWIGDVLDTPGAFVRNTLAGRNPFPGIFDADERISGRDLLKQWGVLDRDASGFWPGVAGFLADVALDPTTYLTFGASAGGKGLQVANRSGLLKGLSKAAPNVGKRVGRMTTSLDDLIRVGGPDALQRAQDAAQAMGVNLADVGQQKLGGLVGFSPKGPFGESTAILGTHGPKSQAIAKRLDDAGEWLSQTYLGRQFNRLIGDPAVMGASTVVGQKASRELFEDRQTAREAARAFTGQRAQELLDLGWTTPKHSDKLRRIVEGVDPTPPELQNFVSSYRREFADELAAKQQMGLNISELVDPAIEHYWPREASMSVNRAGKAIQAMKSSDPAKIARLEAYKGIAEGTDRIKQIASDGGINRVIETLEQQVSQGLMKPKEARRLLGNQIERSFPGTFTRVFYLSKGGKKIDAKQAFAKRLMQTPAELRRIGLFGNDPVVDAASALSRSKEARASMNKVLEVLADPGVTRPVASVGRDSERLGTVLRRLGLKAGEFGPKATGQGALWDIARRRGLPAASKDMLGWSVPKELADDITRMVDLYRRPEVVNWVMDKVIDSTTNLTKSLLTSIWPAFNMRNLNSGAVMNWIIGAFSPKSYKNAIGMMRGGVVKDAHLIPIVARELAQRGLPATPEAGTDIVRQLAHTYEIAEKFAGETGSAIGRVAGVSPKSLDDLLAQYPGGLGGTAPFKVSVKGTNLDPRNVRGVSWGQEGARESSTFLPAKIGQDVGSFGENLNRLAPFIALLRKGYAPRAAAMKVHMAHVRYGGRFFTPFERETMTRLVPFYKFTRGMLPYTVRNLIERPGGKLAQVIRGSEAMRGDSALLPEDVRQGASIPLPPGPSGQDRFITGLGLMHEDPLKLLGSGTFHELLSRINPLLKIPVEIGTGASLFQPDQTGGRPIEDMDPMLGRLITNIGETVGAAPPGSEAVELPRLLETIISNSPLSRAVSTAKTLTDPRKGLAKIPNVLTGIRVSDVPEKKKDAILRDAMERLLMKSPAARKFQKVYVPKEELAAMPETDRQAIALQQRLLALLAKRATARAKAAKKAD